MLTVNASPVNLATVHVALVGLGTVGRGVYTLLSEQPAVVIDHIVVKNPEKQRPIADMPHVHTDMMGAITDPAVNIVVEVMGGLDAAYTVVTEALKHGKHVVTANKALIATHAPELFALAKANNARLLFEGAVAGGIPIIAPLKRSLAANRIEKVAGILNGTTNYILTRMSQTGASFNDALKEAQDLGFAEADPTSDVEGIDPAFKIAILASLAYGQWVDPAQVSHQGITQIGAVDIENARSLGYAIKLIGLAQRTTPTEPIDVRVHPMLLPLAHPLASIHLENNAVWVKGHAVGDIMFYGKGAGELPTASAVAGDILSLVADLQAGVSPPLPGMQVTLQPGTAQLKPLAQTSSKFYLRLQTQDSPGVIGQLGTACGDHGVSLESVMQMHTTATGTATIVLVTHEVQEADMQAALATITQQPSTQEVACVLRVW
jgi:homoserine dehydrogenase